MRACRTLAQLFERTETETELGGRTVDWSPIGDLWLALKSPQRSGDRTGGMEPVIREQRLAESRSDPRVQPGQRVDYEGVEWRLVLVDRDRPTLGRMTLTLQRDL